MTIENNFIEKTNPLINKKEEKNKIENITSDLIKKIRDLEKLQYCQPTNFIWGVLSFKTKEQRKKELTEKINEIEIEKEKVTALLLSEESSIEIINFLKYAIKKDDTLNDAKWSTDVSPSERVRQFAEDIVIENLSVFEKYIENTTPEITKEVFLILEKIIQRNQQKIFEAISEGETENPEEQLKNFDLLRSEGELPKGTENSFTKLPGSNNYLTVMKFIEKQAPIINEKINEGLKQEQKLNEIIHEYVPGVEMALKYLPITQAKEFSNHVGKLFTIQDDNNRGVLDFFIAEYAAEINKGEDKSFSKFSIDRAKELNIGSKVFATAGYEYKEIGIQWFNSTSRENIREMMLNNFTALHILESERPGSAKYLTDNFGIVCFSRYPTEVLIKQYDDREKTNIPFGIYATGRSDHNGSMYGFDKKVKIEKLASGVESHDYMLKIIEIDNTVDGTKKIINLTKKLDKKVSFFFINTHGNSDTIAFGNWGSFRRELNIHDINKPGMKKFLQYFENDATLVLSSCLTGSDNGIAEEIAKTSGIKVVASKMETMGIDKLEIFSKEKGHIDFDVTFFTGKTGKGNVVFNEKE